MANANVVADATAATAGVAGKVAADTSTTEPTVAVSTVSIDAPSTATSPAAACPAGGEKSGLVVAAPYGNEQSKKRRREELEVARKAKRCRAPASALVVFGLGNAEARCAGQRHNFGESALGAVQMEASPVQASDGASGVRRVTGGSRPRFLLPPQGHINGSGAALRAALKAIGQEAAEFLVIVDDVSLPLGVLRLKAKGSSGGHNALKDIEKEFGHKYHRLKLGIGGSRSKEHVVDEFASEEQPLVQAVLKRAAQAIEVWLDQGPEQIEKILMKVNGPDFCKVQAEVPSNGQSAETNAPKAAAEAVAA